METRSEVSVEYVLKPSDVYTPFQFSWRNLLSWTVVFVVWCGVYDLCFSETAYLRAFPDGSSIIAVVVLVAALLSFGLVVFPWIRVRTVFKDSPALHKTRRITFSPDGFHIDSADARGDYKWSLFVRVVETRNNFIFMMTTGGGATYVPKRSFQTHDDIEMLRTLIRQHFAGKWTLRRE